MARTLNVQTPGEAPKTPDIDTDVTAQGGDTVLGPSDGQPSDAPAALTIEELKAKIAALEAENKTLAAKKAARDPEANRKAAAVADAEFDRASRAVTRADREKFRHMSADEVDPSTLVAAVLTKDGWVAPDQTGQKPKA
ncbi:hypothetical protein [Cupriavidus sp. EM10]|uniref:hypothetical protein n=1 Tax=Cupriavidus sp. EM10 TaxID=2839983 RepID=UPI001C0050BA|nr:hypothetical protein [Cupriavidus sp. EM10]QWE95644.1 hypothetical protein KLP38_07340 [Cupriavidus sp. EM10]